MGPRLLHIEHFVFCRDIGYGKFVSTLLLLALCWISGNEEMVKRLSRFGDLFFLDRFFCDAYTSGTTSVIYCISDWKFTGLSGTNTQSDVLGHILLFLHADLAINDLYGLHRPSHNGRRTVLFHIWSHPTPLETGGWIVSCWSLFCMFCIRFVLSSYKCFLSVKKH